jgi:IS1 family transposase
MHFVVDIASTSKHDKIMNRMDTARRAQVVRCLIEGSSVNSTVRMTGVSKVTILKLLVELGAACADYMDVTMRDLPCERIQADETWAFCFAKRKNVKPVHFENGGYAGDIWKWVAIDADTKLIPSWLIGMRNVASAHTFIEDLAGRLANRVQLTTDGLKLYINAVDRAFGEDIDYAMLVKIYGQIDADGQRRYSPATCIGCERHEMTGRPDPNHISTSYVERQNLTMRMSMRRFTRLTNGFSKKLENHSANVALYFMYYNFAKVHMTLKKTPAMAAGISDHVWSLEEVIGLLENREQAVAA